MAKQMIYTAQNIKAEEALRIGLVNAIYPQNELLNEAKKLAEAIVKNGPNAIKLSKKAINEGIQVDMDKAIEIKEKLFGECFETSEQREGMQNFLNKSKNKKPKNLKETPKVESKEIAELPKGELKPIGFFSKKFPVLNRDLSIHKMPAILTAGDKNHYNSLVIGWGTIGIGFSKPLFTVFIKPERYTYQFIEKSEIFTVSYIDNKLYPKFIPYGAQSGKDINKEEVYGTHIKFLDDGGITFEEAVEVYVCKIVAKLHPTEKDVHQEIIDNYNGNLKLYFSTKPHGIYIGEIIGHYKRE
jgi:flavin reductase (DIM6/NTAB) family NADH-FMN oxidoreductase RutF